MWGSVLTLVRGIEEGYPPATIRNATSEGNASRKEREGKQGDSKQSSGLLKIGKAILARDSMQAPGIRQE